MQVADDGRQSVKFTNVRREFLDDVTDLALEVGIKTGMNFTTGRYQKGNSQDITLTYKNLTVGGTSPLKDKLRSLGVIRRDTFGKLQSLSEEEMAEFLKGCQRRMRICDVNRTNGLSTTANSALT